MAPMTMYYILMVPERKKFFDGSITKENLNQNGSWSHTLHIQHLSASLASDSMDW